MRFILLLFFLTSCSQFSTNRSFLSEMEQEDDSFYNPNHDFPVVAGDSGRTHETQRERRLRTPQTEEDRSERRASQFLKSELDELEERQPERAMKLYDEHKHRFSSISEKIYYLKLPHNERQAYLESRGFIQAVITRDPASSRNRRVSSDLLMGMSKNDVLSNLGKPNRVEVAGNPNFENERWLYQVNGASKYIYFESGRVEGWE